MRLADLPTPAVLVDRPTLQANIAGMQQAAAAAGLRLRPHAKTHKSATIAGWQLEAGAVGVTVAKTGEAEVLAAHGVRDIRVAYPLPVSTAPRIVALMTDADISIAVDHPEVAGRWSEAMVAAGRRLDVLVKVDVGFHRCGIDPRGADAIAFVAQVATLPGLRLRGLLSHAGQAYAAQTLDQVSAAARQEAMLLGQLAADLRAGGLEIEEISVGSTPTARFSLREAAFTELRPGNYVFFDLTQVALGAATVEQCALTVLSTVVSRPSANRIVLDAGSKTLSSDLARGPRAGAGFGAVRTSPTSLDATLTVERLSEEHAVVAVRGNDTPPAPGDRVRLVPNHACVVVNLADTLHLVDGDRVVGTLPVDARGRNR